MPEITLKATGNPPPQPPTVPPPSENPTVSYKAIIDELRKQVPTLTKDMPRDPVAEEILDEVKKHTILLQQVATSQQLIIGKWNGLVDALGVINRNVEGLKRV